jgi:hypothetical protein
MEMAFASDRDKYQIVSPPTKFYTGGFTLGIKVPR